MELLSVRLRAILRAAIYTYNNGSVVGNAGKYNIYGNIANNSGGIVDLTANSGSFIEGW
ncbi:MAG: hypothetical protein ACLRXQ_00740 [Phascolarctobacterium faecium]